MASYLYRYTSVTICFMIFLVFVMSIMGCAGAANDWTKFAERGDVGGLDKYLKNGMPIDKQNGKSRQTALIRASYSGQAEAVEFLCKKGAAVNIQDRNGATALINASYYNKVDVVEILLKYNADKSIKDMYGNTAYDYADEYEYTRLIKLLQD